MVWIDCQDVLKESGSAEVMFRREEVRQSRSYTDGESLPKPTLDVRA